jgi:hypothetical protein
MPFGMKDIDGMIGPLAQEMKNLYRPTHFNGGGHDGAFEQ